PLAGLACDRVGAWRLLALAIPVYAAYIAALETAPPRLLPLLWVAPLYPLLDTPLGLAAAEAVGEHRGAAALAAAYTAAGIVLMASAALQPSPLLLAEAGLAAAAASLAALSRSAAAAAASKRAPARPGRRRAK
ncbi:MAG: hypothetical protein GXO15_00360, partial [Crenarchaeota archaeon]|nr:hypothetical protein [Thermoproteota archaeon]